MRPRGDLPERSDANRPNRVLSATVQERGSRRQPATHATGEVGRECEGEQHALRLTELALDRPTGTIPSS